MIFWREWIKRNRNECQNSLRTLAPLNYRKDTQMPMIWIVKTVFQVVPPRRRFMDVLRNRWSYMPDCTFMNKTYCIRIWMIKYITKSYLAFFMNVLEIEGIWLPYAHCMDIYSNICLWCLNGNHLFNISFGMQCGTETYRYVFSSNA